jgi:transcriptional regulator GlxA family with amidase domain
MVQWHPINQSPQRVKSEVTFLSPIYISVHASVQLRTVYRLRHNAQMAKMTNNTGKLPNTHNAHRVAVVVFDGVIAADFAAPCEMFGRIELENGQRGYEVELCGVEKTVECNLCTMTVPRTLSGLHRADTIVIPGISSAEREIPPALIKAICKAANRGARIASICSGAFVLAATGLLNGLRATTHWLAAAQLARCYPEINVDANVLYVDEGQILTSAGASAGLDLCLHMVRRDYGPAVAARAARLSVAPLERAGGQAQFIQQELLGRDYGSLQPLLQWIEQNLGHELTVDTLAARTSTSIRTLNRRFIEQTSSTPMQWVFNARVRSAQYLLEATTLSIERVAGEVGFGSGANFRERFRKIVGVSPQVYRRSFSTAES